MPVFNFDLEDGKPPVTFNLKPEDAARFMGFMAHCEGDQKDAARYRWLRDRRRTNTRWPHITMYPWHESIDGPQQFLPVHDAAGYHPERLDAWIDAGISAAGDGVSVAGKVVTVRQRGASTTEDIIDADGVKVAHDQPSAQSPTDRSTE